MLCSEVYLLLNVRFVLSPILNSFCVNTSQSLNLQKITFWSIKYSWWSLKNGWAIFALLLALFQEDIVKTNRLLKHSRGKILFKILKILVVFFQKKLCWHKFSIFDVCFFISISKNFYTSTNVSRCPILGLFWHELIMLQ